jgi:Ni/Fe-hydrogenase subunit HybB-like protein
MPENYLQGITHTIQLAVAPVFLLTALGTTLSVLTTRLSRIVDRARRVEARLPAEQGDARTASVEELRMLESRVRLVYLAITLGTSAALLVCLLIAVAFVGYLAGARVGNAMAVLFIAAMTAYVGALVCFLREVFAAVATMRFNLPPEVRRGAEVLAPQASSASGSGPARSGPTSP